MLTSRYPAFDMDHQAQALAAVRDTFERLPETRGLRLRISGVPLFAVQSRALIRDTARRLSWLASVGVALILLAGLRSLRLVALAALPVASGVLAGAAATLLLFGHLHTIALAFGITLIGVAVDYPIHQFTHAAGQGVTPRLLKEVWPIMRLGLVTTCLGFSALLFTDFGGLSQLGSFSIAGLLAAGAVTRFVLPTLVGQVGRDALGPLLSARLPSRPFPWLPPLVALLAGGVLLWRGAGLWEHDLARLSPVPPQARTLDRLLREEMGAPEVDRLLLITGSSAEQVLRRSEALEPRLAALRRAGVLAHCDLPSRWLPSIHTQRQRQATLPGKESLAHNLEQALQGLPFKPGLFAPFLRAVERSRALPPLTPAMLADTPLGARLGMLLSRHGDTWVALATLSGLRSAAAVEQLAKSIDGVSFVDLARDSARLVRNYRDQALRAALWGAALIVLVLGLALRRLRLVLRVVSPLLATVLGSAALLALAGQQLSLFHLVSLLLVLGIGTDYALFVALTPRENPAFPATVGSLFLCALSTLLVFGLLAVSGVPVLAAIGLTVFTGTVLSLLLSVAMLR
jgi:predicted exporter